MRSRTLAVIAVVLLAATASADRPARNISKAKHPNLAAAQGYCVQAYDKIEAAQRANEWDLGGHAKRAKELLEQASDELKQAALAANTR
jgi:hypothetical protein